MQASGVVPQISLVMGPCAGGAVYSPAITDFVLMVEETSYMFITGPDVVKTVTGEDVSFEELGGAATHATKSGVAHFTAPDEETCLEEARYLLSFLPQNNLEPPPYAPPADPVDREDAALDTIVPDSPHKPYDMKDVIERVVDDGDFLEVQPNWAENIVCGFARLGGYSVGVVGNQPAALAGVLDIDASVEGRAVRADVRRVQRPARDVRRRPRLPARDRAGVGRDHPPRREAALRVRGGDRPEAHGDHAQGVRRRLRRHVVQAHPRGLQRRLADRRGCGDGAGGRRQHRVPARARERGGSGRSPRGADRGLQGALRESVHGGRARVRRRRDRAAADAARGSIAALETALSKREPTPKRKHGNIPL